MINKTVPLAIAAALLLGTAAVPVQADEGAGVKVGMLSCKVEPGWSYVVGSTKALNCSYAPSKGRNKVQVKRDRS